MVKYSREEKQEMVDHCKNYLDDLKFKKEFPKSHAIHERFLVLIMEAPIHD